jgi:hypothetical protein
VNINVVANDFDMEGDALTVTSNTQPANGTLVNNGDGTFTYTPNTGFTGVDTFTYTICDNVTPTRLVIQQRYRLRFYRITEKMIRMPMTIRSTEIKEQLLQECINQ